MRTYDEAEVEVMFQDDFDDVQGDVYVAGYRIETASELLAEYDPHAYRQEFLDWLDTMGFHECSGCFMFIDTNEDDVEVCDECKEYEEGGSDGE